MGFEIFQNIVAQEAEKVSPHALAKAREELTARYRAQPEQKRGRQERSARAAALIATETERLAYMVARAPATYAVVHRVLSEVSKRLLLPSPVKSLLDLGAGAGSAMWAACDLFPALCQIDLVERDEQLVSFGKRCASESRDEAARLARWHVQDMRRYKPPIMADLTILSYAIGELLPEETLPFIDTCWSWTKECLVVIEPGTPRGFARMRAIRQRLLLLGGKIVAPCPHGEECPIRDGDWCHFAERVERSSLHRRIKGATLSHEDEKFSYVAMARAPASLPPSRLLRHPVKHSGHLVLTLCTHEGISEKTLSKRDGTRYKQARKLNWGDTCSDDNEGP